MGSNPSNISRNIHQATRDLPHKIIRIRTPQGEKEIPWLRGALRYDYNDDNIVARLILHEKITPMLSDLRAHLPEYWAQDVAQFRSVYSFRVYQVMMQCSSTGCARLRIDDLRYMLMLTNKYIMVSDLIKNVIEVAVKEINKKTLYKLEYNLIKKSRKFVAVEFKFELKRKSLQGDDPFVNFKMTKKQMAVFASKIKQATNQDVDEIIAELSNVHLQGKHVDFLKVLDFVPSKWYSVEEIKEHKIRK